uniref:Ubiquitin-like domain-containing protein n=1 Tax=Alexandrium monilatum TaxID=311494 RepID=A0A7S4T0H8_9DINO
MDDENGATASATSSSTPAPAAAEAEPPVYEVSVKCIDGSTTKLEVPSDLRGSDVKELIAERLGVPMDRQRLIFRGRVLKDDDIVGQHISENGLTLHMVQRPGPPPGADAARSSAAQPAGGEGPAPPDGQPQPGQVHFQFTQADGGGIPLGMPQVDLSQVLGTVFGAVGRGAGLGVHAAPIDVGFAGGGTGGRGAGAAPAPGTQPGSRPGATSPALEPPQGQPPPPPPAPGDPLIAAGGPARNGPNAAVALQPLQIIFQQGLGNLAHFIPLLLNENGPPVAAGAPLAGASRNRTGGGGQVAGGGAASPTAAQGAQGSGDVPARDSMPWRDLRRLHQHLARLLGRPNPHRTLPPANMPVSELYSFLAVLLNAITQLGVAVGDFQASIADGTWPHPRYRLQLAMAMVAAARTLRGVATATTMQSGFPEVVGPAASAHGGAGDAAAAPRGSVADDGIRGGSSSGAPAAPGASSDSEEVPPDDLVRAEAHGGLSEEDDRLEQLVEAAGVPTSVPAPGGQQGAVPREEGGATGDQADLPQAPPAGEAAQLMQMLPQLFGQLTQPFGGRGGGVATGAELDSLPPEVASCWHQWTQPERFRRVVAQAIQPPFSEAYLSGDATGSHRAPALPSLPEFLPLRWRRSAGRVDGLQDVPEPPEHLSRAYLSAFLRDLGRHVGSSSTYASIPQAQERYPHLAQLAGLFSPAEAPKEEQDEPAPGGARASTDSGVNHNP